MCTVSTPKVQQTAEKPVQVFTNRYFTDSNDALRARLGRNQLKINAGSGGSTSLQIGGSTGLQT